MSVRKQRLELTWIGKDERPNLEPRILLEDESISYHAKAHVAEKDIFDNILIHGDNLLALKALEQEYTGRVKCVFIDPPYNTGSAFEHYDDGVEHSLWLSLIRDRLEIIARLLSKDGSLWITIDDNEAHYLKVLCDEILGRANFVANVVWQKKYTVSNDAKWLAETHDHVLVYAKNKETWRPNRLERTVEMDSRYRNPDNHPKGPWKATPLYAKRTGSEKEQAFSFRFKNGVVWTPPRGTSPRFPADALRQMDENDEIWFGSDGDANPSRKTFLSELKLAEPPAPTVWLHADAGNNHEAREEVKAINPDDAFATPKPEKLLKRVVALATDPGDLVLDSFAGSGTTGAVAHKMGRRWIMVELGQHCETHIVPRMRKVIDGEDRGGITEAVEWKGGGGFRYYSLAPSLLEKDAWDNWVIAKNYYDPAKLAQAVCKLMGFVYQPDETHYWMQGRSSETDFIYVTTQSLTHEQLAAIAEEVGDERTLLVCCKAFHANADAFPNLTIRKIPQAVLRKCEWGKDDYSLNVANLPEAPREPDEPDDPGATRKAGKKNAGKAAPQDDLFSGEAGK